MGYRVWQQKAQDAQAEQELAAAGCGRLLSRVLVSRGCRTPEQARALLDETAPPVSYTHLDVYKRQPALSSMPT